MYRRSFVSVTRSFLLSFVCVICCLRSAVFFSSLFREYRLIVLAVFRSSDPIARGVLCVFRHLLSVSE